MISSQQKVIENGGGKMKATNNCVKFVWCNVYGKYYLKLFFCQPTQFIG